MNHLRQVGNVVQVWEEFGGREDAGEVRLGRRPKCFDQRHGTEMGLRAEIAGRSLKSLKSKERALKAIGNQWKINIEKQCFSL